MIRTVQDVFSRAIQNSPDNRNLRISKKTGDLTTAKHGFFSRAVRFLIGPTRKDIENNRKIIGHFVHELELGYGRGIAQAALLKGLARARLDPEGHLEYRAYKPLTVREVRKVLTEAEAGYRQAKTEARAGAEKGDNEAQRRLIGLAVMRWGPGGWSKFAEAARADGVDPGKLGDDHRVLVLERLAAEVEARTVAEGKVPSSREVKDLALTLAREAGKMKGEEVEGALADLEMAKEAAGEMLEALAAGDEDSLQPMLDLLDRNRALAESAYNGIDEGEPLKPAMQAIERAVSDLEPGKAEELYDALTGEGSRAVGVLAAHSFLESSGSGRAVAPLAAMIRQSIAHLAWRGEIEHRDSDLRGTIKNVADSEDVSELANELDQVMTERSIEATRDALGAYLPTGFPLEAMGEGRVGGELTVQSDLSKDDEFRSLTIKKLGNESKHNSLLEKVKDHEPGLAGTFWKDVTRQTKMTLSDEQGRSKLALSSDNALQELGSFSGDHRAAFELSKFMNQSLLNNMLDTVASALPRNERNEVLTFSFDSKRDQGINVAKISDGGKVSFVIDYSMSTPIKGIINGGGGLLPDLPPGNSMKLALRLKIAQEDLEKGRLDAFVVDKQPEATLRLEFPSEM
jgi:hypothetical protein